MKKVLVVTPTYERDLRTLHRCMGSMRMQTYSCWDQIVCSDKHIESTAYLAVKMMLDHRISYRVDTDTGVRENTYGNYIRKELIASSYGYDYICFLDDDNLYMPTFLETMVELLENNKLAIAATCNAMYYFGQNPKECCNSRILTAIPFSLGNVDPVQVMVRADVMRVCGWDTERGYESDGVTFDRLATMGSVVRTPEVLSIHF